MKLPSLLSLFFAIALCLQGLCAGDVEPEMLRLAQQELKTQGYYAGPIDGVSGSQTAAAVRRFQLAKDLKVTGKLNRQTLLALGIHPEVRTSKAPRADTLAFAEIFSGGPFVNKTLNEQQEIYFSIRDTLQTNGYLSKENIADIPNQAFKEALKNWQTAKKLQKTGRIDTQTAKLLGAL
ncbi:MAG: peptidoglycan-binding domain-containing protein [Chthoniobacterales bacterium]